MNIRSKISVLVVVATIIVGVSVIGGPLLSNTHNFESQQLPLLSPNFTGSLDGQVMMQVTGSPSVEIPIMKEMGVTTAMIITGAADPAYANVTQIISTILPYKQAGFKVGYEFEMQGFWGRTVDMNFPAFEYAQNNPAEAMATFRDTVINSSNPPYGSQILQNGSLVVPLETGAQYYVYQFYSPSSFTWFYNESHFFIGSSDRSLCFGQEFCYQNPIESGSNYLMKYGNQYRLFYNATGLYLVFQTVRAPKVIYNLHWISFDLSSTGGYWGGKYYGTGLVSWPSLFFQGGFDSYLTAWIRFCQEFQGYVNIVWEDSGGFTSLDANPSLINYLEAKYHFNFTFNDWAWTHGTPGGNVTESEFLWNYENYQLISSFASEKQSIAHHYGMLWIVDSSDQNAGDSFEYGYLDGLGVGWQSPSLPAFVHTFATFYTWAGYAWYSNSSLALGVADWEGSPRETVSTLQSYFHTAEVVGSMYRPQGTFIAFDWQFPLSDVSPQIIQAMREGIREFESAISYGRFITSSGAQRYTLGTLYLSGPLTGIQNIYPSTFYEASVIQAPVQYNTFFAGVGWSKYIGQIPEYNQYTNESNPYACNIANYIVPPWGIYGGWGPMSGSTLCYLNISYSVVPFVAGLIGKSSSFYVSDVYVTYVFQEGELYYVLLDNWLNTSRSVVFSYHNLNGYLAVDLGGTRIVSNGTELNLPPLRSDMLLLEPISQTGVKLLYTNATFFTQVGNGVMLYSDLPANIVLTIQTTTPIGVFSVALNNGTRVLLYPNTSRFVESSKFGSLILYTIHLDDFSTATVYALTSSQFANTSSTTVNDNSTVAGLNSTPSTTSGSNASSITSVEGVSSGSSTSTQFSSSAQSNVTNSESITLENGGSGTGIGGSQSGMSEGSSTGLLSSPAKRGSLANPLGGGLSGYKSPLGFVADSLVFDKVQLAVGVSLVILVILLGIYVVRERRNSLE
jgi:hypothetical protein